VVLLSEANSKFGAPVLRRLLDDRDIEVVALVTRPAGVLCDYYVDEPHPVDLARMGDAAAIPVLRPGEVNAPDVVLRLQALHPDYFIIANYQQIMREPLLAVPAIAAVNFHPSPLPRYAGLAPFFWMAKNGERRGGVSAALTGTGIDDGPLLAQRELPLTGTETTAQIRDTHFQASWQLLDEVLPTLIDRSFHTVAQDLRSRSYYGRPAPQDYEAELADSTGRILSTVRAAAPRPGATLCTTGGQRMKVLDVEPIAAPPVGFRPQPGKVYRQSGQLVARTADGWLGLTCVKVSEAVLARSVSG
jgi:methionyl-tRNA formyltransferase